MKNFIAIPLVLAVTVLAAPRAARADADKEHQLLMAEIRMLQENQQQLRQVVDALTETLKVLNARLDTDAGRMQRQSVSSIPTQPSPAPTGDVPAGDPGAAPGTPLTPTGPAPNISPTQMWDR